MNAKFQAILWDCDGVVMDSEYLACGLAAKTLTDAGFPITTDMYVRRFCGQGKKHIHETIAAEAGFDIWAKIDTKDKHDKRNQLFKDELKAIAGIEEILLTAGIPMAIASGSDYERLHYTLDLINLRGHFGEHIYSSVDVPHGKPAPDIFLYAANKLGVAPQHCLVVEDSLNGVRAGKAANMTVFGFTGGTHVVDKQAHAQEMSELGADWVFHDMRELKTRLQLG